MQKKTQNPKTKNKLNGKIQQEKWSSKYLLKSKGKTSKFLPFALMFNGIFVLFCFKNTEIDVLSVTINNSSQIKQMIK